jgi:hypothetical protein
VSLCSRRSSIFPRGLAHSLRSDPHLDCRKLRAYQALVPHAEPAAAVILPGTEWPACAAGCGAAAEEGDRRGRVEGALDEVERGVEGRWRGCVGMEERDEEVAAPTRSVTPTTAGVVSILVAPAAGESAPDVTEPAIPDPIVETTPIFVHRPRPRLPPQTST